MRPEDPPLGASLLSPSNGVLARLRNDAQAIARSAIEAVRPDALLEPALARWRQAGRGGHALVIAAGKAAGPMLRACLQADLEVFRGVVVAPQLDENIPARIDAFRGGHPLPTDGSVAAATRALAIAREAAPSDTVFVLLSGGASALLSAPADGLTLDDKVSTTKLLLSAGAAIHDLNCVRKHLSAIKGGRLAAAARCRCITWALSDVVGPIEDDPSVIGSGPTVGDPTTFDEAIAVVDRLGVRARLPRAVRHRLERGAAGDVEETPKPGDDSLSLAEYEIVGGRRNAMHGARDEAARRGYRVLAIEEAIVGEARDIGPELVARACAMTREIAEPCCVISSGETTVQVRGKGRGGRNQELALAAAPALAGSEPCVLVSVGTDGVDGPTDAAGAVADTTTCIRATRAGLANVADHLRDNDAYSFFDRLGDLIRTGPTHTNVGDLQVVVFPARSPFTSSGYSEEEGGS